MYNIFNMEKRIVREFEVGEEIILTSQLNGEDLYKEVVVVAETSEPTCEGCIFADGEAACTLLCCYEKCRSDMKNVIFKRKQHRVVKNKKKISI